jgi:hypothetical protein
MKGLSCDDLLMKPGTAHQKAPATWRHITAEVAANGASSGFWLDRVKLAQTRPRKDAIGHGRI